MRVVCIINEAAGAPVVGYRSKPRSNHASCVDGSTERFPFPVAVGDAPRRVSGRYQIIVCLHLSLELMIRPPFPPRRDAADLEAGVYTRCTFALPLSPSLSLPPRLDRFEGRGLFGENYSRRGETTPSAQGYLSKYRDVNRRRGWKEDGRDVVKSGRRAKGRKASHPLHSSNNARGLGGQNISP